MSDERIDIEVSDKVDKSVETKLRSIAAEARQGHSAVERLKAALADINSAPVQRLADASAKLTNALARELNAQTRLTNATNASAAADAKAEIAKARLAAESARAATAEQRLATEAAKTQAAVQRAAQAQSNAAAAALRAEAAQRRAATATDSTGRAAADLEARMQRLKTSVDPLGAAFDRLNAELLEAQALYARGAISATDFAQAETVLNGRIQANVAAQQAANAVMRGGVQNSKALTQAGLNLSRQFADIGVTAAMGMNPLMILIQQGPQIADAFAMAKTQGLGFTAVLRGMWAALVPFLPILIGIAAVVGTVAAGFALLDRQLRKSYPKDITEGLNLTEEQLDRVKSKTVTFGDTVAATFTVLGRRIMESPVGDGIRWIGELFSDVMDWITKTAFNGITNVIAFFIAAYKTIVANWKNLPAALGAILISAANGIITVVEGIVNGSITLLNKLISSANNLPGVELPQIDKVSAQRFTAQVGSATETAAGMFDDFYASAQTSVRAAGRDLARDIGAEALARARRRALSEAGDPNKGRGGARKGREEWDRAGELANINRELDNELSRMGMLKDAREVQNRLDQISQKFAEKGVPLTEAETAAFRAKIESIQRLTRVQAELDRINDAANGPQLKYNATLEAANKLRQDGVISAERYAFEIGQANRALAETKDLIGANAALREYEETLDKAKVSLAEAGINQEQYNRAVAAAAYNYRLASDPLARYNDELQNQIDLLGYYGPQAEKVAYLQGVNNDLLAQGRSLYDASTGALTAEGAALAAKFDILQRGKQVQEELNAIYADVTANQLFLTNMTYMYDEIERMRREDLLSEEQANRAKAQLQNKYEQIRLANTQSFFSDLASLSSSGNAELAAIGKAAAVAQATIDGYLAVQKALAAAPPPLNYALAAAAAVKAAAQVTGIMSTNVGGFATGGQFMVNGEDGRDNNLITMAVSKGERVTVETAAQQRAAAMGGSSAGAPNVNVPVKVVNVTDPAEAVAAMDSAEGERVVLNIIARNRNEVNGSLQGSN